MYSPKISEDLIPVLYHTARDRDMPMTRLVDQLLYNALLGQSIPAQVYGKFQGYQQSRALPATKNYVDLPYRVEAEEAFARILRQYPGMAFERTTEIEAWYHGCLAGLGRAVRLRTEGAALESAPLNEHLEFVRLLCAIRHEARALTSEVVTSGTFQ